MASMKFDLDLTDDTPETLDGQPQTAGKSCSPPSSTPSCSAHSQPTELVNPVTGEVVSLDDVDGLIDTLEQLRAHEATVAIAKREIVIALVAKTDAEKITTKTRRVRGQKRRAKLTMPDTSWDQGILREAWHSFPSLRDQLLRIGRVEVKAREFGKARNEAGPDDFKTFVAMIVNAERQPTGMAQVQIEE